MWQTKDKNPQTNIPSFSIIKNPQSFEYANIVQFKMLTETKMSPTSLSSSFTVFVHRRLQVSTSHLSRLHTGPWLALKLWCHKILLVCPGVKLRLKVSSEKLSSFSRWMKTNSALFFTVAQCLVCFLLTESPLWQRSDFAPEADLESMPPAHS